MKVVIDIDTASPVAFRDLYEDGDEWIKIKGCNNCPKEQRIHCCGNCPCIIPDGNCYWQVNGERVTRKSLYCIITPLPIKMNTRCCIEYKCIKGSKRGKIRRVKDKLDVFI